MNYTLLTENLSNATSDCICLPVFEKQTLGKTGQALNELFDHAISSAIERYDISAEAGKAFVLPIEGQKASRIILLGFGPAQTIDQETLTKTINALTAQVKDTNIKNLCIALNDVTLEKSQGTATNQIIRETITAIENSLYNFDQFKSKKPPESQLKDVVFLCPGKNKAEALKIIQIATAQANGVRFAKDLGNLPGNVCTPTYLAEQAELLAEKSNNFSVKILNEDQMQELNMGAFLSVSKGSIEPGKLIIIEYKGGKQGDAPHMLIGKGITFDSGGISLKPGPQMDEMKYDMCGAASVLGTMLAIAELQPELNIVSIIATAENMPAGNASKPGDIVTTASGQTVEILNTDAEGRLVLCDALTYAEKYKPASVVDIATLTGACIVALGHCTSAVMGNDDETINELLEAGKQSSDKAWQLPIWDDYQTQLDSPFADMQNIGGKGAGSITAACFLSRFTKTYKWAHLDVAGTAWVSGGKEKGATGRPVPMLLQYLINKQA